MNPLHVIIVALSTTLMCILLIFSQVRHAQGKAEGFSDGYRQALKEFRIGF